MLRRPSLILLALLASHGVLPGCFTPALPCQTEAVDITGSVVDEEGELLTPQAAAATIEHTPDGCIRSATVTIVGPGGQDCELRAEANDPRPGGGVSVTSMRITSTGDCGWPASVNGTSTGTGDSWVEFDGVDTLNGNANGACVVGSLRLELNSTLTGNSSELIAGTYTLTGGLISTEIPNTSCPAGDDDDSAADDDDAVDDDDSAADDDDSAGG